MLSTRVGVRLPGSSSNSSSRGEKPLPTGRTEEVGSLKLDGPVMVSGKRPLLTPLVHHGCSALRTAHRLSVRLRRLARHRRLLEHPRPHPGEPLVQCLLDLLEG